MKELVFATHNQHKIIELTALFCELPIPLKSLDDFPPFPPDDEDEPSFELNAASKAVHSAKKIGKWCLADDSGLEVAALGGRPGIHSARYAADNVLRIQRVLKELDGVPQERRQARFVSAMALASPEGDVIIKTGYCEGVIISEMRGSNGFGYDPIFFIPQMGKAMAELSLEQKNRISHRARSAQMIIPVIKSRI